MLVILVLRRQRQENGCKVKGGQHQMSQPVKVLAPSLVNEVRFLEHTWQKGHRLLQVTPSPPRKPPPSIN